MMFFELVDTFYLTRNIIIQGDSLTMRNPKAEFTTRQIVTTGANMPHPKVDTFGNTKC